MGALPILACIVVYGDDKSTVAAFFIGVLKFEFRATDNNHFPPYPYHYFISKNCLADQRDRGRFLTIAPRGRSFHNK